MAKIHSLKNPIEDRAHIPQNVINLFLRGEIKVQCPEILKGLLKQYPEEPSLLRMYADLLIKSGASNASNKIYGKTAKIFLEKGRIIRALATKLAQWQICAPKNNEVIEFIFELKKTSCEKKEINRFFHELTPEEAASFLPELELMQFKSKNFIKKIGDFEDRLYFVVSGTLKDSLFLTIDNSEKLYRKPTVYLSEDDYFGNLYPFEQLIKCRSYIESTSNVELISITKKKLIKICKIYPNIERQLIELFQIRTFNFLHKKSKKVRSEKRIKLHLEFGLEILLNTNAQTTIQVTGYSNDVSIGGISLILDEISVSSVLEIPIFEKLLNHADVLVSFEIEDLTIKLPGKIRWAKKVSIDNRLSMALGIQFGEISPRLKGLLMAFFNCFEGN
jgi:CRP-like cAMP-binding protein